MTLASEITTTERPGRYHLAIGETDSYAGLGEFYWLGRLDEIDEFARALLEQVEMMRAEAKP